MAGSTSQYSILVDVQLNEQSIKQQLKAVGKDAQMSVGFKTDEVRSGKKDIDEAAKSTRQLVDNGEDLQMTFNVANEVFSKFSSVIKSMVDQVYELDGALTEFKKVSDLNGQALDEYTNKLSEIGKTVGRTGKPNRSEPVCCDGKAA